jgi:hypothetical protein
MMLNRVLEALIAQVPIDGRRRKWWRRLQA